MVESNAVVRVFQNRSERFQKTARPIFDVEVLDVVPNRQALPSDNVGILWKCERFGSFFGRQGSHQIPLSGIFPLHPVAFFRKQSGARP
jgi:hypothetical protein